MDPTQQPFRSIIEALPAFVWIVAPDGAVQYSNGRWLQYTGLTAEQSSGSGWECAVHPDDIARMRSVWRSDAPSNEPYEFECRFRGADGKYRWFLFRSIVLEGPNGSITGRLASASDIDKQKSAQAQQSFLALASDLLGSTLDVDTTLERIARLAIASLGTWCQIDLVDADGVLRAARLAHHDPEKEALLRELTNQRIYNPDAQFGPPATLRSGKAQMLQNVRETTVEHVIPDPKHRAVYGAVGYAAGIMVPLRSQDAMLGVLGIASDDPTRLYSEFDRATALDLGRRGAAALENAQSFARERQLASTLQRALLPSALPRSSAVRFWSAYAAVSRGEDVGGDWYDAFAIDDDRIAISLGDVAGHGVDAAITMSLLRQTIRVAALDGQAPSTVLSRANRALLLEARRPMTTAIFGVYDVRARALHYSIAGHPRPLRVESDGTVCALEGGGPPLGDAFEYDLAMDACTDVPAGAALVFYTDGLTEYDRNLERALRRLHDVLAQRAFLAAPNPAQAVIDAVLDKPQQDDIAVLVMQAAP